MLESSFQILLFVFVAYMTASLAYYFWGDQPKANFSSGPRIFNDQLGTCPACGEKAEKGFAPRNSALTWIRPKIMMKQFGFIGKDLNEAGLRSYFISRAAFNLSYHCSSCNLYMVDYSHSFSRKEANQLAESVQ